jgi:hypothetical protein
MAGVTKQDPNEKPVEGFQIVLALVDFPQQYLSRHELPGALVGERSRQLLATTDNDASLTVMSFRMDSSSSALSEAEITAL